MEANIKNVLSAFGILEPSSITQIYKSAWDIDDVYVLKFNGDKNELEKSIVLNRLLLAECVPVVEYIETTDGNSNFCYEDKYWCLMKKVKGICLDPFIGDIKYNGIILGKAVALIHKALKNIEDKIEIRNVDFSEELSSWIVPELDKNNISFKDGVMEYVSAFLDNAYHSLPRQPIHRDMHTSNLIFENETFTYIDFDLSQRNVRVFDLVYLACSQLVDNYKDKARLQQWQEIFSGILQGYSELSPLSETEIKAIPPLIIYDEMLFTAFYLKTGNPEIAKSCEEMTNWMYENIDMLFDL